MTGIKKLRFKIDLERGAEAVHASFVEKMPDGIVDSAARWPPAGTTSDRLLPSLHVWEARAHKFFYSLSISLLFSSPSVKNLYLFNNNLPCFLSFMGGESTEAVNKLRVRWGLNGGVSWWAQLFLQWAHLKLLQHFAT